MIRFIGFPSVIGNETYEPSRSWSALKAALVDVKMQQKPPTLAAVVAKDSAWNRAAMALLGAPKIELTWTQGQGLTMMGLSELLSLYYAAQAKYKADSARDPGTLPAAAVEQLKNRMTKLRTPFAFFPHFFVLFSLIALLVLIAHSLWMTARTDSRRWSR